MNAQRMPFLCRLGLHQWSGWGEKFKIPGSQYHYEYQQKRCLRCGLVHERTI